MRPPSAVNIPSGPFAQRSVWAGQPVGAEITRLRVARGWSQQKLADELGYTERYIGQLSRGTKNPTLRTMADLAKAFSTEVSAIIKAAERRHQKTDKR